MGMSLVSILIACFKICGNLSVFASSNRRPFILKLNLSMLRRWDSIMSMNLIIVVVTSFEIS